MAKLSKYFYSSVLEKELKVITKDLVINHGIETCLYGLVCPERKVIRYIGKSNNPWHRYLAHLSEARTANKPSIKINWLRKLSRNNQKPLIVLIDKVHIDKWEELESHLIELFKGSNNKLVNQLSGGEGISSQDVKGSKNPMYGVRRFGKDNHFYGRKHTKETIDYLRSINIGKESQFKGITDRWNEDQKEAISLNQKSRKVIHRYTKEGVFIDEWQSIRKMCDELGFDRRAVQRILSKYKNYLSHKGFLFVYKGDSVPKYIHGSSKKKGLSRASRIKVKCTDLSNGKIREFPTLIAAAMFLGKEYKRHPIMRNIKGFIDSYEGYLFERID